MPVPEEPKICLEHVSVVYPADDHFRKLEEQEVRTVKSLKI
jgi:hypothetical protein